MPSLRFCNLSRTSPPENIFPNGREFLKHFPCDLSDAAAVERVAREVEAFLTREVPAGKILLINNSGIGAFGAFHEAELLHELRMIDLNVRAVVQLTGLLLPLLFARGGAIVNIASVVAYQPTAYAATYGATKAFVLNWTVALNEELRGSPVHALAVCPGTTRTEFFERAGVGGSEAARFAMTSESVVESALYALAAGQAEVVPGWKNRVMTFFGARITKALGARLSAKALAGRASPSPRAKGGL